MSAIKIEHIAIWVQNLELMKDFYIQYFNARSGSKYTNPKTGFVSYFISFGENGPRLELMSKPGIEMFEGKRGLNFGLAHFAISLGRKEKVDELTERFRNDKFIICSEPRTTGDGYYESVVLDPEGNYLEITG